MSFKTAGLFGLALLIGCGAGDDADLLAGSGKAERKAILLPQCSVIDDQCGQDLIVMNKRREQEGMRRTGNPLEALKIASSRSTALVVWYNEFPSQIMGMRLSLEGEVIDREPLLIAERPGARFPSVASDGKDFLVVWMDGQYPDTKIAAARVSADGGVFEPVLLGEEDNFNVDATVIYDGTDYVVAWSANDGESQIVTARLSRDGTVLGQEPLMNRTLRAQLNPALATNGDVTLVAWADNTNGITYGVLDGLELPEPQKLMSPDLSWDQQRLKLVATPEGFMVLAASAKALYLTPIARDGAAGETKVIEQSNCFSLWAASSDAATLFAWDSGMDQVDGAFIKPNGVAEEDRAIQLSEKIGLDLALTSGAKEGQFLVLWRMVLPNKDEVILRGALL